MSIRMLLTDSWTENSPSRKLSLGIYGLFVSPSVINIPMDLQMNKVHQKKFTHFTMLVYLLVNITYHG